MKNIILFISLFIITSCVEEDLSTGFDQNPIEFEIDTSEKGAIFADGVRQLTLTAKINPNAKNEYTTITFKNNTANSGEFEGKDKDGNRVVKADNGSVSVKWKVPNTGGIYYVEASIGRNGEFKKEIAIEVKNIDKGLGLIWNKSDLKNIQADDTQTIIFTGKVSNNLPVIYRTLIFECSDGKFQGTGEEKRREIVVNEKGEASITWKVGTQAGKKYVSVSIKDVANAKVEQEIELIAPTPYFKMTVLNKNSILADGTSLLSILIDSARNISSNKIQIIKNAGEFVDAAGSPIKNGEVVLSNGKANIFLKMGQNVETYFIKSQNTESTFFLNETFIPNRAFGDEIFTEATLQTNKDIKITTYLKRPFGKVSVGTPINLRAYQIVNNIEKEVGVFQSLSNAFTDADEKTKEIILKSNDDIVSKIPIYIVASSKNQKGETISTKPVSITYP